MRLYFKIENMDRETMDLILSTESEADMAVDGFDTFEQWTAAVDAMDNEVQCIKHDMSVTPNTLSIVDGDCGANFDDLADASREVQMHTNFMPNECYLFFRDGAEMQKHYEE